MSNDPGNNMYKPAGQHAVTFNNTTRHSTIHNSPAVAARPPRDASRLSVGSFDGSVISPLRIYRRVRINVVMFSSPWPSIYGCGKQRFTDAWRSVR